MILRIFILRIGNKKENLQNFMDKRELQHKLTLTNSTRGDVEMFYWTDIPHCQNMFILNSNIRIVDSFTG